MPVKQLARWLRRRCRMVWSTPSIRPMKRLTSLAHSANPARNLAITEGSGVICCIWRFCKCLTVISRMSAFSNLEWRALSFFRASNIRFFNSDKLLLIRARLRFSIIGFVLRLVSLHFVIVFSEGMLDSKRYNSNTL